MKNKSQKSKNKYFRLADLIVAAVILTAATFSLISAFAAVDENSLTAVITVGGQMYREINLSAVEEPYDMTVEGNEEAVLHISSEGVRFVSSHCPDKLCVNTGLLTKSGQSAVCLPARVSVKLVSDDNSGQPDAVVG